MQLAVRRRLCGCGCAAAVTCSAAHARAGEPPCGAEGRPWVRLETTAALSDRTKHIADRLSLELTPRGIDLCAADGASETTPRPTAVVKLSRAEGPGFVVDIDVTDSVTDKHVERRLDLSETPADTRIFTLAVSVSELLAASWAEIALARTAPTPTPPPKAVSKWVETKLTPPAPIGLLAGALAFDHATGGQTQWGGDVRGGVWVRPWIALGLRVGLRSASRVQAPNGSIGASAVVAGVFATVSPASRSARVGLDAVARADAEPVTFSSEPRPGAVGQRQTVTAWIATAALCPWVTVLPGLRLFAEGDLGIALLGARAADAGRDVTGLSGVVFGLAAGVSNSF